MKKFCPCQLKRVCFHRWKSLGARCLLCARFAQLRPSQTNWHPKRVSSAKRWLHPKRSIFCADVLRRKKPSVGDPGRTFARFTAACTWLESEMQSRLCVFGKFCGRDHIWARQRRAKLFDLKVQLVMLPQNLTSVLQNFGWAPLQRLPHFRLKVVAKFNQVLHFVVPPSWGLPWWKSSTRPN